MADNIGKEEEEIIIVEDKALLTPPEKEQAAATTDDDVDEATRAAAAVADDDEEDEEDDDGGSTEGADREAIRERRRQEKKERKERRDQAIKRDKLELDFLRQRNDDLERRVMAQEQRTHKVELSTIDDAITKAQQEAEMAERVIAKAVEAGNGDDVTQAMRYRDQAMLRTQQLNQQKQAMSQQVPQPKQQPDEAVVHYAKAFIQEHPWYDVQGRDEDSAIVIAIDQSLARDGYDPRSSEYWDELRKRAAKRIPERFEKPQDKPAPRAPRGGPVVGSSREHAPASTRKEVYISPERKQALIDAGVWDDPVLRKQYVKRYAEYDKEHKNT